MVNWRERKALQVREKSCVLRSDLQREKAGEG